MCRLVQSCFVHWYTHGVATISRLLKITGIQVFAKEPYKRDDILRNRPVILRSLLLVATPYLVYVPVYLYLCICTFVHVSFICIFLNVPMYM